MPLWTGSYNTADGYNALNANNSGGYNTAIGSQALLSNVSGNYNTAVGDDAMKLNIGGATDLAVGYQALENGTNLNYSTAVGYQSLKILRRCLYMITTVSVTMKRMVIITPRWVSSHCLPPRLARKTLPWAIKRWQTTRSAAEISRLAGKPDKP